jgi:hypothetical protein
VMAVTSCDGCGGRMNSELVVCPHCGARRARSEQPRWSKDEIQALLATDAASRAAEPPRGMFQTLVMPHPATSGRTRVVELVLTGISLPLVIVGAGSIGLIRRVRGITGGTGELVPAVTMTVFGGVGLLGQVPLIAIVALLAAMWTRAWIRAQADAARGRDLLRIEPVAREPSRALPAAHVVRDKPTAAPPALPEPVKPAAPSAPAGPEPAGDPGDGPRLLR